MNRDEKLTLFWVFTLIGIACIGVGIGNLISVGAGWLTGGLGCIIAIPFGLDFSKKYLK